MTGTEKILGVFCLALTAAATLQARVEPVVMVRFRFPAAADTSFAVFGENNGMVLAANGTVYAKRLNETSWEQAGTLPKMSPGAVCVQTQMGIVCIHGGKAFLLSWDNATGKAVTKALPDFPSPAKDVACAAKENTAYVVSGQNVLRLEMASTPARWAALPALPAACEKPIAAIQNTSQKRTALFVFDSANGNAWCYDLTQKGKGAWDKLPPTTARLTGTRAVVSGDQHILFIGGENRNVTAYHTVTGKWFDCGALPEAQREGAAVVLQSDGRLLIAGGKNAAGEALPDCVVAAFHKAKTFHPVNLAVMLAYLIGMLFIGVYFMRRNKNADDYFRGGGRLPWWAISMSLYATMFSSITFLSIPAMSYLSDCRYVIIMIGIIAVAPFVSHFYLPFFRKLNLTSAYEFLEVRFNLACRLFASAAFSLFMVSRTAIVTYLPAIAISAVADIPVNTAIVLVTVVTILYCTMGGIEAVVWSDFIQSVILIAGTVLIAVMLVSGTDGGFGGFLSIGQAAGKFRTFDFALDYQKPVFWVVLVGGLVANLASYTSDQCIVQRYMATKDEAGARKSILFNGVFSFFNAIFFFLLGVGLYTFFSSHPGLLDVTMPKNDSIFPLFIADALPVGVNGLIFAALAAATMSTLSANLNSSATAVTTDFYVRLTGCKDERKKLRCGQIATMATGLLGGAFALVLANMQVYSIYDQFQRFLGLLTGGLACLFFMGIFMRRVTGTGALCGLVANYAVCFYLDQTTAAWKPHLLLFGAIGLLTCLAVASIVSLLFHGPRKKQESESR